MYRWIVFLHIAGIFGFLLALALTPWLVVSWARHRQRSFDEEIGVSAEWPRVEMSAYAPRLYTFKINPEKIRDVIGKGGAVIRALTEETGTTIDIQEDGTITIASSSAEAAAVARARIDAITAEVEIGKIYEGTVLKILDFGAIVSVLPGKDGLLHI